MTKHPVSSATERVLGTVGLVLLVAVAKLAERSYGPQPTFASEASGYLARRAIDAIAVIGWLVDRLPERVFLRSAPPPSTQETADVVG
jgi:hypothetical protein